MFLIIKKKSRKSYLLSKSKKPWPNFKNHRSKNSYFYYSSWWKSISFFYNIYRLECTTIIYAKEQRTGNKGWHGNTTWSKRRDRISLQWAHSNTRTIGEFCRESISSLVEITTVNLHLFSSLQQADTGQTIIS